MKPRKGINRERKFLKLYDRLHPCYEAQVLEGEIPAGTIFGRYEFVRSLGGGGDATAVRVRRPIDGAVFVMRIGIGNSEISLARFNRQIAALGQLSHEAIPRHHEAGLLGNGRAYLLMDFVPGQQICQFADRNRLTIRARLELFARLCDPVALLHGAGLVHCDLKPDNLLVSPDSRVHIVDFDAMLGLGDPVPAHHPGTSHYRAPERLQDGCVASSQIDVFSLGVVLYELLVGYPPYKRLSELEFDPMGDPVANVMAANEPDHPSVLLTFKPETLPQRCVCRKCSAESLSSLLADELGRIAIKAVAKMPADRYGGPSELKTAVRWYLSKHGR